MTVVVKAGQQAPDFELESDSREAVKLSDLRGKGSCSTSIPGTTRQDVIAVTRRISAHGRFVLAARGGVMLSLASTNSASYSAWL